MSSKLARSQVLCGNWNPGLNVVDLAKDPRSAGSLARSTTRKLNGHIVLAAIVLFTTLLVGQIAQADVLYDNGPLLTHPNGMSNGANRSAISPGDGTFGFGAQQSAQFRVADDVNIGAGWTINSFRFFTYQTGSSTTSTITGVTFRIWQGNPNTGSVVFGDTTTNVMTGTGWTGMYRTGTADNTNTTRPIMFVDIGGLNLNLAAGNYFLDWSLSGTLSSGPWVPAVSSPTTSVIGNALRFTPIDGSFVPLNDAISGNQAALPFIINGFAIPEPSLLALLVFGASATCFLRRR